LNLANVLELYDGVLADEANASFVSGFLLDGLFYGTISSSKRGKFFIESAKKFNKSINAATIIYNENDVNLQGRNRTKREANGVEEKQQEPVSLGCGSTNNKIRDWMQSEQKKLYEQRLQEVTNQIAFFFFFH
jgi:hypothetical protein